MRRFVRGLVCLPFVLGAFATAAWAASYTTFSVTGAVGTYPTSINTGGTVAGTYSTGGVGVAIGFVRTTDGTITTFNPPNSKYVLATVLDDSGNIYGSFQDMNGFYHGYYRPASGTIQVFDINNAQSFTAVYTANNGGLVAGSYNDNQDVSTGFIYYPASKTALYTFTIPNAAGIVCWSVNDLGVVAGDYVDTSNVYHGFLWFEGSAVQTFDVPNLQNPGTYATAINGVGTIAGFAGSGLYPPLAFVRSSTGTITTFAPRIAERVYSRGINSSGQVAGYYADAFVSDNFHGLIRETDGRLTTFDVPKASSTTVWGINDAGLVTGYSTSRSAGTDSGYIRTP